MTKFKDFLLIANSIRKADNDDMKRFFKMKHLIVLAIALLLSIAPMSWKTLENVPFCIKSAGCNGSMEPKGTVAEYKYGYPLSYRETSTFTPINNDQSSPKYVGYAEATTIRQNFDLLSIVINTIFWYALITSLLKLLPVKKPILQPADVK